MKKAFKLTALLLVGILGLVATTNPPDHGRFFEISKNLEVFTNLYKELNTYYVDEIDPAVVMRTGIDAMVESLDPYTNYISESQVEGYRLMTEGRYTGLGADFMDIDNKIVLVETQAESPAVKAGLKAGDVLLGVDGNDVKDKDIEQVNEILKGFPGTEVELLVNRPGVGDQTIRVTRDEINLPNVPYSGVIRDGIAYVALSQFTKDAGRNVQNALQKVTDANPDIKGIVLDLRGNPGGLLQEAVNVTNIFVPKGERVVTTKGKVKEWNRSFKTLKNPAFPEMPVVVLINGRSASASEIVAGALQDLDRGVLIGQRSFGKGLVQNQKDVGYNSRLKLTIAKYYIPSGRCIQGVEYEDGEPVDIPDDQRTKFKTLGGRTVLDGGGVKPDMVIDRDDDSDILNILTKEWIVFDFATEFAVKNPEIGPVDDFQFTAWADFVAFLEKRDYNYDTPAEQKLNALAEQIESDHYLKMGDITSLQAKIKTAKRAELEQHKELIIDLVEKEIASRYYLQEGRIRIGLRNDQEVVEAVDVLLDPAKYAKLLK
ncbi:MAG: S41 family peptidase [Saprospiraceae bacterium]